MSGNAKRGKTPMRRTMRCETGELGDRHQPYVITRLPISDIDIFKAVLLGIVNYSSLFLSAFARDIE